MSNLTKIAQNIFGSSAGVDQIAQFGSLAAGSATFTTDPAAAQNLSQWLNGWFSAAIDTNSPAIEDMNAFCFVVTYQLAYLMQKGIAQWDSTTTYYKGALVLSTAALPPTIYYSLTDANQGNAVSDPTNWLPITGFIGKQGKVTVFTTSGTFTTDSTSTTNTLYEYLMLGGGGGGGGANGSNAAASGGGAGGLAIGTFTGVAASTGISVTVGSGGSHGSIAPTNGAAGGSTILGSPVVVTVTGGAGGLGSSTGGQGGAAGGGVSAGSPLIAMSGATGQSSSQLVTGLGIGAMGGGTMFGSGGVGGAGGTSGPGSSGIAFGTGGGGAIGGAAIGGDGANGIVIIRQLTP